MRQAKKQQGNLSPENYIRQRARLLPIHECLVSKNWRTTKIANVIVTRRHINGNLTFGVFLVDLLCLGVKNTTYKFNISNYEFEEYLSSFNEKAVHLEKTDYKLAHNIVFAGFDYATEIGIAPHPDFLKTTQFILEEDNDNIELVEIECGKDGFPTLIMGKENKEECQRYIAKLNRSIGSENYRVFMAESA